MMIKTLLETCWFVNQPIENGGRQGLPGYTSLNWGFQRIHVSKGILADSPEAGIVFAFFFLVNETDLSAVTS